MDGYDEAIVLDEHGHVSEGSAANIFMVRDGRLVTPPVSSNILEGITRRTIMQLAAELGYRVVEKRITRDEVYIADEAFFTGTAAEVTPIRELDGRSIGTGFRGGAGFRGAVTQQLQSLYFDAVHGRSAAHEAWLAYV
jgi:branched-chain amino acid aminotransferase